MKTNSVQVETLDINGWPIKAVIIGKINSYRIFYAQNKLAILTPMYDVQILQDYVIVPEWDKLLEELPEVIDLSDDEDIFPKVTITVEDD